MGGVGPTSGGAGKGYPAGSSSSAPGLTTEFAADNPQVMPVYQSPVVSEAAKRKRQEIAARSGRGSTNLVGNPGTRTYQSSFLGSVA